MITNLPHSAAAYLPFVLRYLYDAWAHGVCNHLVWKVPTRRLIKHFVGHAGVRHLDPSAGTGFLPDHCRFPTRIPAITLVHVNPHCLAGAGRRLARYHPWTVVADLLAPLPLPKEEYLSIHLGYRLHCLPGPMSAKVEVLKHLRPHLHPMGCLFASSLLPDSGNASARWLTRVYNQKGIFGNAGETLDAVLAAVHAHFPVVTWERVGQAALFSARPALYPHSHSGEFHGSHQA